MPRQEDMATRGIIMDIVTGVVRGTTAEQTKLDEIVSKIKRNLGTPYERTSIKQDLAPEREVLTAE